jgi:ElaB/YqjD/DUF883 family membrane-anchored ribosome-binding protein
MAKALSNQEIAPLRDKSGTEIEELASGINAGPAAVPRGPQRIVELKPRYAAVEGQRASEGAVEWKQAAEDRIEDLKTRGKQAASQLRSGVSRAYENLRMRTLAALQNGKQKSGELASNVRRRSRYVADEYPVQTIAAVAGVAFICGVLLRIWRSNRYE